MRKLESRNPALKVARNLEGSGVATINGVLNKTMFSIFLTIVGASITWIKYINGSNDILFYAGLGLIGGLVAALITAFAPSAAPITVPIYSILEGLFLGAISAMYSYLYEGIVLQAVLITIGILVSMLVLYRFKVIRATPAFRKGIFAATLGIAVVYLINILLSLIFGVSIPYLHTATPLGIGISVVIIIIAALNFIIDFDNVDYIVSSGAPKKMEWIGAFGIMTTLVWMYLEVLRLLSYLRDN